MATVVLLGTLDTKRAEYDWLKGQLLAAGVEVLTVDVGNHAYSFGRYLLYSDIICEYT